jgi:DNA-binding transcriptional regulator YiaG
MKLHANQANECARLRATTGLNQTDFATLTRLSLSTIKKVESGAVPMSDRVRLKIALVNNDDMKRVILSLTNKYLDKLGKILLHP